MTLVAVSLVCHLIPVSLHYAVTNSYSSTTFLLLSDIPLQTVITFTSHYNITHAGAHKQLLFNKR